MPRPKKFTELNKTFNIDVESTEIETTVDPVEIITAEETKNLTFEKDVSYVFAVLNSTIEKSKEALDCALELAQETDSSRAYEVVGQLVKQTVESAEKIIEIHKKIKDIGEEKKGSSSTTNNTVFIGTTAEALKMLKAKMNELEEVEEENNK